MVDTIYIEDQVRDHPRTCEALQRFPKATVISCQRYTEIFNPRAQNFRLQKKQPALIIASKYGNTVLPAPPEYQIGADRNYYFSHMLNCLYDCRYCFLQGMYRSAHYVWFVNYSEFESGIDTAIAADENQGKQLCFFSGYDCDSLAMESITGFAEHFLTFFESRPQAWMELRTKSIQTQVLSSRSQPLQNVILSYTLTPDIIAREVEHGAPPLAKRLDRIAALAQQGWQVGLRFDPLIPWPGYRDIYGDFFDQVFSQLSPHHVHSATIGPMRFPSHMYERIIKLYPDDPMLARFPLEKRQGQASFHSDLERELVTAVNHLLADHLPDSKIYSQVNIER